MQPVAMVIIGSAHSVHGLNVDEEVTRLALLRKPQLLVAATAEPLGLALTVGLERLDVFASAQQGPQSFRPVLPK